MSAELSQAIPSLFSDQPGLRLFLGAGIFILTYLAITLEKLLHLHRTVLALIGAALMLLFVLDRPAEGGLSSFSLFVDFNVIFLLVGMMIVVNITSQTGVFQFLAIWCAKLGKGHPARVIFLLVFFTALLSAFLDNVTTVLLFAPLSLTLAKTFKADPALFLIPEALASNIGGTATLIGDPPNIMIGSFANLNFMEFLTHLGPFIFVLALLFCVVISLVVGRLIKDTPEIRMEIMGMDERSAIRNWPLLNRCLSMLAIVILAFTFQHQLQLEVGVIALIGASLLLLITRIDVVKSLHEVEWGTLFFFVGLFILVKGAEQSGAIASVAGEIVRLTGHDIPLLSSVILWFSGISSGVVDNIPLTATCLPLLKDVAEGLHLTVTEARPLYWALALGACLGGNLTLIGAAANVVVCGFAEKEGCPISFWRFLKWGVPTTLVSLGLSTVYVYFFLL